MRAGLAFALFAAALAAPLLAQASAAGEWRVNFVVPTGTRSVSMVINQQRATLSGTVINEDGEFPLERPHRRRPGHDCLVGARRREVDGADDEGEALRRHDYGHAAGWRRRRRSAVRPPNRGMRHQMIRTARVAPRRLRACGRGRGAGEPDRRVGDVVHDASRRTLRVHALHDAGRPSPYRASHVRVRRDPGQRQCQRRRGEAGLVDHGKRQAAGHQRHGHGQGRSINGTIKLGTVGEGVFNAERTGSQ